MVVPKRRQELAAWLLLAAETTVVPAMNIHADRLQIATTACEYTACLKRTYDARFIGASFEGFVHPWRLVDLPWQTCTCGDWENTELACVHAMLAAVQYGVSIGTLYDANSIWLAHFRSIYHFQFLPWPSVAKLDQDLTTRPPFVRTESRELGTRSQ